MKPVERPYWGFTLARIQAHPRYLANQWWGEPRKGHPEATIAAHIDELLLNLRVFGRMGFDLPGPGLTGDEFLKLSILIHVHDTFKPDSHARRPGSVAPPILDPDSHASIARAFLSEFTDDQSMLATVQYHDEPFALYRQWKHKGKLNAARFGALLKAIPDWDLFIAFVIIDGTTAGKATAAQEAGLTSATEPRDWFLSAISQHVTTRWTVETVKMVDEARKARDAVA